MSRMEHTMVHLARRLVLLLALLLAAPAAALPQVLTYTGYLKTAAGSPVTTASLLTFRLYLGAAEPTPVWSEQIDVVPTSDGWFSAVLGSVTPIPGLVGHEQLWLGIQVGSDAEFAQRLRLTPSPAALTVDWAGVTGKPQCGAGQFLTLGQIGDLVCASPPASGLTAVAAGEGLLGQGTNGSPLAVRFGEGGAQRALTFPGPGSCPPGQFVQGVDPGSGAAFCRPAGRVDTVTAAATPGNPIQVTGGTNPVVDMDQSRLLPPSCAPGQVVRYEGLAQGWTCAADAGASGVTVELSLTGDGLPGAPLAVRLGDGLVLTQDGVGVNAGPGLTVLPGTGQLALDLPAAGGAAGASAQPARADHRHPAVAAVQLRPADFVDFLGAPPPVLGTVMLDANSFMFQKVHAWTLPSLTGIHAVAQYPAGVGAGTTATVHVSLAGASASGAAKLWLGFAAYGPPGTSQVGNLSDTRTIERVLPVGGSDLVTFGNVQIHPRVAPAFGSPPVPGDLFFVMIQNTGTVGVDPAAHVLGVQITFHTP